VPKIARRGGIERKHGELTAGEIKMLSAPRCLWREPFREMDDEDLRALYRVHRDAILADHHRWHPDEQPHIYWLFEPGVPEELRELPEYVFSDGAAFLVTGVLPPNIQEYHRIERARTEYLRHARLFRR
jgi:hypothetical protein